MNAEHLLGTAEMARTNDVRRHEQEAMADRQAVLVRAAPDASTPVEHDTDDDVSRSESGSRTQTPDARAPLFPERDVADLRQRWSDIQTTFVDEPRQAVERGDSLVAEVMKHLAESFANERTNLERQWARGDNVTTEDLRVALQRYRSFFDRLLSV